MADSKLADLTATTALASGDLLYAVRDPAGTPVDRKITAANLTAALALLDPMHLGLYFPESYGAVHDGSTADQAAINSAITAANAAGAGIVVLGPYTYAMNYIAHPTGGSTVGVCVVPKTNVWIRGSGQGLTTLKLKASQSVGAFSSRLDLMLNSAYANPGTDTNIKITDLTIDGDGDNQTGLSNGITLWGTDGCEVERVHVRRNRGTSAVPPNERFAFSMQNSSRCKFTACLAEGGIVNSATGFAGNYSTDCELTDCEAFDFRIGHGFTIYACAHWTFSGCRAYDIPAGAAFNNEYSQFISYDPSCQAGRYYPASTVRSSYVDTNSGAVEKTVNTAYTILACGPVEIQGLQAVAVKFAVLQVNMDQTGLPTGIILTQGPIMVRNIQARAYASNATCFCSFTSNGHKYTTIKDIPKLTGTWNTYYTGDSTFTGSSGPMGSGSGNEWGPFPGALYSQEDSTSRTPTMPGTGVDFTNDLPFDVDVQIQGGTGTIVVYISHTGTLQTSKDSRLYVTGGIYRLHKGGIIRITSTGTMPTWKWFAVY